MIDYDKLNKSLKHLELQFANYQRAEGRPELTELDREGIAESVIQRSRPATTPVERPQTPPHRRTRPGRCPQ